MNREYKKSSLQVLVEAYATLPLDDKELKARSLRRFGELISTVLIAGYPLKRVWRQLCEVGYVGDYTRFNRVVRSHLSAVHKAKGLQSEISALTVDQEGSQLARALSNLP